MPEIILKVPEDRWNKIKLKNHKENNLITIFWYDRKKKKKLEDKQLKTEYDYYESIRDNTIKKNTFYKDNYLSNKNSVFDYYKVIKPNIEDDMIGVQVRKYEKKEKAQFKIFNGKFIIKFD
jgi:hypothetical protein